MLARMAAGLADDLASTVLLATDKPVWIAPAMNHRMWSHPATQRSLATLRGDGVHLIEPNEGTMACGEFGIGRMAEPHEIVAALLNADTHPKPLAGKKALVTSGSTHEPIDPVRYITNRSSGKQGFAIAASLAALGAEVTLITGPTSLTPPTGVTTHAVTTAQEMLEAALAALPADIAVCAAAVSDWHVAHVASQKIKKTAAHSTPRLTLVENPDILARLAQHPTARPLLVVGFAAETHDVLTHARDKRSRKGCDWIVANDVSSGQAFNRDDNAVTLITESDEESFPLMPKTAIADALATRIATRFSTSS
jgi:phosphopantothenoylcysteine decarboxylase/phosphopantothenate--cysteine ligase